MQSAESRIQNPEARSDVRLLCRPERSKGASGFTLIELLVAMSILLIITMIVAQVFQQANRAWDTGMNKAEVNMKGRAVADFIARELSQAVYDPGLLFDFQASGDTATFWMLKSDAAPNKRAVCKVQYSKVSRNVTYDLFPSGNAAEGSVDLAKADDIQSIQFEKTGTGGLPDYVTVTVTVTNSAGPAKMFSSTVYFRNRDRYRF